MSWGDYPHDICRCGDYRSDHESNGKCRVCPIGMAPWNQCSQFVLSHHANDAEAKHWREHHEKTSLGIAIDLASIQSDIWNVFIERGVNINGNLIAIDRQGIKEIGQRFSNRLRVAIKQHNELCAHIQTIHPQACSACNDLADKWDLGLLKHDSATCQIEHCRECARESQIEGIR